MVFVTAQPEAIAASASRLHAVGAVLAAQHAATAAPMTGLVPAAADEVSLVTAAQFATHAAAFQTLSAQAAQMHEMFVSTLQTTAGSYAATEAANAATTA